MAGGGWCVPCSSAQLGNVPPHPAGPTKCSLSLGLLASLSVSPISTRGRKVLWCEFWLLTLPRTMTWSTSICHRLQLRFWRETGQKTDFFGKNSFWQNHIKICCMDDPSLYIYNIFSNRCFSFPTFSQNNWSYRNSDGGVQKLMTIYWSLSYYTNWNVVAACQQTPPAGSTTTLLTSASREASTVVLDQSCGLWGSGEETHCTAQGRWHTFPYSVIYRVHNRPGGEGSLLQCAARYLNTPKTPPPPMWCCCYWFLY